MAESLQFLARGRRKNQVGREIFLPVKGLPVDQRKTKQSRLAVRYVTVWTGKCRKRSDGVFLLARKVSGLSANNRGRSGCCLKASSPCLRVQELALYPDCKKDMCTLQINFFFYGSCVLWGPTSIRFLKQFGMDCSRFSI